MMKSLLTKRASYFRYQLIVISGSVLLTSCVNYGGKHFADLTDAQHDTAVVYIYSAETGCVDLGQMNTDVIINSAERGTLLENSYSLFYLKPGEYAFSTTTDNQNACHGQWSSEFNWPVIKLQLKANERYFLQYNPASEKCITTCDRHLSEVSKDVAIAEMQGTHEIVVTP